MAADHLDPTRLFYIYIIEGSIFLLFMILGLKIFRKDRKRLNLIFSCFYFSAAIGLVFNFIYVPLSGVPGKEKTVLILNFLTIYLIGLSLAFLVMSVIIILKSAKVFDTKYQLTFLLVYCLIELSLAYYIPRDGVIFTEETNWMAAFSLPFYLTLISILTFCGVIPTLYFSIKIKQTIENPELKSRWNKFIGGIICIFTFMYATYTLNFINRTEYRDLWLENSGILSGVFLLLIISGALLIYHGVGKQLKE